MNKNVNLNGRKIVDNLAQQYVYVHPHISLESDTLLKRMDDQEKEIACMKKILDLLHRRLGKTNHCDIDLKSNYLCPIAQLIAPLWFYSLKLSPEEQSTSALPETDLLILLLKIGWFESTSFIPEVVFCQ